MILVTLVNLLLNNKFFEFKRPILKFNNKETYSFIKTLAYKQLHNSEN